MSDEWKNRQVLVLGMGETGLSAVRWLAGRGALLRAADTRAAPPALGAMRAAQDSLRVDLGPFTAALLEGVDTVVASPGVALREPVLVEAARRGVEIVGDIEIFGREVAKRGRARVIGITGTNGKSTVTALAGAMARAAGLKTVVAGNIGLPVLDALAAAQDEGEPDLYVVELSSYQLETTSNLHLEAAAMLNLTQDHLDRYDGLADYARAKQRIFGHCKTRVVNRDDARSRAMAGAGRAFTFGLGAPAHALEWGLRDGVLLEGAEPIVALEEMVLRGLHNAANGLAAHAVLRALGAPPAPLALALRDFRGLPHRGELVAESGGVRFYDDSKATNVGAAVAALGGMRESVVLIAGGDGKGQDFSPLASAVRARARAVVLIGRDAEAIARSLAGTAVAVERAATMVDAVRLAHGLARSGDAVLLSPACASFDMFTNYAHRGEVFAAAARALAAGGAR